MLIGIAPIFSGSNLNTSYVKVQLYKPHNLTKENLYLNTSYVKVQYTVTGRMATGVTFKYILC